ncbi:MAG: lysozyme inhibitor LprI family protein [Pedobacter sp.]
MRFKKKKLAGTIIMFIIVVFSSSPSAQAQSSRNTEVASGYERSDKELNQVYKQILKDYAGQPLFIAKLKVAQRLWIQLRDAELGVKFPKTGNYGSVQPMCEEEYLSQLTRGRIKFLRVWLTGIQEGDVCSGSVKVK